MDELNDAQIRLIQYFDRNGYVRIPNDERLKQLGGRYHHGYEVRLTAKSEDELAEIRQLLQELNIKAGRPFFKTRRAVLPIYGKSIVEWFLKYTRPKLIHLKRLQERQRAA